MVNPVFVETVDIESKSIEKQVTIDYDNPYHTKWLERHSFWAMNAGKQVTILPMPDEEITFIASKKVKDYYANQRPQRYNRGSEYEVSTPGDTA